MKHVNLTHAIDVVHAKNPWPSYAEIWEGIDQLREAGYLEPCRNDTHHDSCWLLHEEGYEA